VGLNHFLIPFLVLDLIVALAVLFGVIKLRGSAFMVSVRNVASIVSLDQMRALETFSIEQHKHIGDYVRANWSGIPDQLPPVLTALLDDLERAAKEKSLPLERDALKAMLAGSLRAHRIGKGSERNEALKRVA
jgi:hypothetical protein